MAGFLARSAIDSGVETIQFAGTRFIAIIGIHQFPENSVSIATFHENVVVLYSPVHKSANLPILSAAQDLR